MSFCCSHHLVLSRSAQISRNLRFRLLIFVAYAPTILARSSLRLRLLLLGFYFDSHTRSLHPLVIPGV